MKNFLRAALAAAVLAVPALAQAAPQVDAALFATAIGSTNLQKTLDFYTKGLGGKGPDGPPVFNSKVFEETSVTFPATGGRLTIVHFKNGKMPAGQVRGMANRLMVSTPNIEGTLARLRAAGYETGKVQGVDVRLGHYLVSMTHDPDGNMIELLQPPK